jgi:hypothetical protein
MKGHETDGARATHVGRYGTFLYIFGRNNRKENISRETLRMGQC